jgi:predicted nucleotidyltransferase
MIEKWKLALREFLKKYEEDDDVIGAILCGSYATNTQNEYSDIDVYLVLKDGCNYSLRGSTECNSYLIEYFMNTKKNILDNMEKDFNNNSLYTMVMFAYGKIIYDLDGGVKELQDIALEYVDKPFNVITSKKLDLNNYNLWTYFDKLKACLKNNEPEFNLIYYKVLSDIYDIYAEYQGIPKLPKTKIHKILTDEEYRRKCHIFKLADENFVKLYTKCFEPNKANIMYKNMETLINYYYQRVGGFNIRKFELKRELD